MSVLDSSATGNDTQASQRAHRSPSYIALTDQSQTFPERTEDSTSNTLKGAEVPRWVTVMESVREQILQDPSYAPEVLIQRYRTLLQRNRRRKRIAVVCSILGVLTSATWFVMDRGRVRAHAWVTYQSRSAQMDPVSLPDGSVLQLNDRSQARVNLTESTRRVVLESGEVFLDVSPDVLRPFNVQAGTARFIAKGTAFSVRKDVDGDIETTVRHGSVEVEIPHRPRVYRGAPEQPPDETAGEKKVPVIDGADETSGVGRTQGVGALKPVGEVKAGEVATIDATGQFSVTKVEQTDLAERLAWADPVRSLDGMTLKDAVELFNRYNVRKLEIADPQLGQIRISGGYHLTQPERFAERLGRLGITHRAQGSESSADARILLMRE